MKINIKMDEEMEMDLCMQDSDAEQQETTDDIFFHKGFEKIVLCLFWRSGKVGAAAYFIDSGEIHLLNDMADVRPQFQICRHLLREIMPTTVITSKTLSSVFLDSVRCIVNELNFDGNMSGHKIKMITIGSKHFQYSQCKLVISKMHIINQRQDFLEDKHWCYLQTLINFDYKMMVSALGALLHFLDTHVSKITLQIPSLQILTIRYLSLDALVWLDSESYKALEIFAPSLNNSSSLSSWSQGGVKEGLCLHSIFNRCHSVLGSRHMRVLLSHPIKDIVILRKRHEVIEFFLKPDNQVTLKTVQDCLKNIHNISTIVLRIIGTQATPGQWKSFYKTIHNAVTIGELCRTNSRSAEIFKEISNSVDESLFIITQLIETYMDFEESENNGRFAVKEGAESELDSIKKKFQDLPKVMESVAKEELANLPNQIESCSLVYLPEIGYLLAVPAWKGLSKDDVIIPGMEFKGVEKYLAMDQSVGDSHLIILRHEMEIMCQIASYIEAHVSKITTVLEHIKLLDCLIAFSSVAREYDMVKPTLIKGQVLDIEKGCHLLTQRCVKSFIPNDFKSSIHDSLVKIFTGPNSAGKSVFLKQVALIVYMAHVGSFVPAEKATIGVVDYIHTRIRATESISTELSSFSLDLRQMCSSLYNSSPNTLVVVDEFGKGTADVDGLSLLYGFVKCFIDRGENCPHVLVATHFQSLISLLPETTLLKLQTFDFLIENDVITHLYKIKDGFVKSSFAHAAAASVGVPKRIIDRANEILQIMCSEDKEPKPQPDNARTCMMQLRKQCVKELFEMMNKREEENCAVDLQDLVKSLIKVRF